MCLSGTARVGVRSSITRTARGTFPCLITQETMATSLNRKKTSGYLMTETIWWHANSVVVDTISDHDWPLLSVNVKCKMSCVRVTYWVEEDRNTSPNGVVLRRGWRRLPRHKNKTRQTTSPKQIITHSTTRSLNDRKGVAVRKGLLYFAKQ